MGGTFQFVLDLNGGSLSDLRYELTRGGNIIQQGSGTTFSRTVKSGDAGTVQVRFLANKDDDGNYTWKLKSPSFLVRPLAVHNLTVQYSDLTVGETPEPPQEKIPELLQKAQARLLRKDTQDDFRACVDINIESLTQFASDSDGDGDSDKDDDRPDPANTYGKRNKHYESGIDISYVRAIDSEAGTTDTPVLGTGTGNIIIDYTRSYVEKGAIEAHELGHRGGLYPFSHNEEDRTYIMNAVADETSVNLLQKEVAAYETSR